MVVRGVGAARKVLRARSGELGLPRGEREAGGGGR